MAQSSLLNTETKDLKELLSNGRSYVVPPYQRDYSWKQEHWEDLWEDLLNVEQNEGEDHYMGALVLESGDRKQHRIIDGQQRLATLSILILAGIDFLTKQAETGIDSDANNERSSLLLSSFIGSKDPASLRVTPKLSLNAHDNDFFQLNLAQRIAPAGGVRSLRDSEKLLWDCSEFFKKKIAEKFGSLPKGTGGEALATFINEVVAERLIFISVRVQDQLSAYTVFETLNARGLELTETDLLKNYLLALANQLSEGQMDHVLRQWNRITERVGIASFPEFLRHHLNSERSYVRQKQLFKTIRREISKMDQVFALLNRLETDAAWFGALQDFGSDFWLDYSNSREWVRVLRLFNVSQYTPLVLAAKDVFENPTDVVEVIRYCAVVSFRFNGISRRSTHILEETYNKAAIALRNGGTPTLSRVRELLRPIYIPDNEFSADFGEIRFSARGVAGKRLRYILACLEKQLNHLDMSDLTMNATVEHILPENPDATGWPEFTKDECERVCERIGNYALLERDLNGQQAGNKSFAEKKDVYAKSQYRLAIELQSFNDWTSVAIQNRQRQLAVIATSIWRLEVGI